MIKQNKIREAIAELIKVKAGLDKKVYYNHVNRADSDYIFVHMRVHRNDEGFGLMNRQIQVRLDIVLKPDEYGEVKHAELYDIEDALDEATLHAVKIFDRFVPIINTEFSIFDDIGHYDFVLDFSDYEDMEEQADLMSELMLNLE